MRFAAITIPVCTLLILNTNPASAALVKRSDDTTIHNLQTLVQQQGSALQTMQAKQAALETKNGALQHRVDILEKKSKSVAFSVHFKQDNQDNGVDLRSQSVLKFDSVITNTGNGYNPVTGTFTAPVTGAYTFLLSVMSPNAHGSIDLAIVKDGRTVLDIVYTEGAGDDFDQGTGHTAAHLQAGNKVWVRRNNGNAVRGSWYTVFTGFLVQAD